jgi:hypothetical protein
MKGELPSILWKVSKNKHILIILILVIYFNNMNVSFDVYCSKKALPWVHLLSDAKKRFAVNVHDSNDQMSLYNWI